MESGLNLPHNTVPGSCPGTETDREGSPATRPKLLGTDLLDNSVWDDCDVPSDDDDATQKLEIQDVAYESSQDSDEEIEEVDDPSTQAIRSFDVDLPLPLEIQHLEAWSTTSRVENPPLAIHQAYQTFLQRLGDATGTVCEAQITADRLPMAVKKMSSLQLDRTWSSGDSLDQFAHALVVYIWQVVCFRFQNMEVYDQEHPISSHCASLFLSAYYVYQETENRVEVTQGSFKAATLNWERRLSRVGGKAQWLDSQLLVNMPELDRDLSYCLIVLLDSIPQKHPCCWLDHVGYLGRDPLGST